MCPSTHRLGSRQPHFQQRLSILFSSSFGFSLARATKENLSSSETRVRCSFVSKACGVRFSYPCRSGAEGRRVEWIMDGCCFGRGGPCHSPSRPHSRPYIMVVCHTSHHSTLYHFIYYLQLLYYSYYYIYTSVMILFIIFSSSHYFYYYYYYIYYYIIMRKNLKLGILNEFS